MPWISLTSLPEGIIVDPASGDVSVASGITPGSYYFTYYLSYFSGSGDGANVFITVTSDSDLQTNTDHFNPICQGTSANVLLNDTIDGQSLLENASLVTVTQISAPNGISVDATGAITIAPTVQEGIYYLRYKVCLNDTPNECSVNFAYLAVAKNWITGFVKFNNTACSLLS
ncbi:hypothetical protein [Flavobacterium sp. 3HN19-14]|uniref:hypothetical protein n=1 Tax=Flavobacterium sp. 3HN19-14 TaxID=3448133 RepID=UPI003EE3D313